MGLSEKGKIFVAICVLSFIFSYLIVTLNFFPHFGFGLSFLIFLIFSYILKKEKDSDTKIYLALATLFSIVLFIRSEPLITFLNLISMFFFGLLVLIPKSSQKVSFTGYLFEIPNFIFKSVFTKSDYFLEFKKDSGNLKPDKAFRNVFGILISALVLIVVLPLLSSANPFFQKLLSDLWNFIGLKNLLKNIDYEKLFVWLLRSVFFLFFIFILPKVFTLMNKSGELNFSNISKLENISFAIPKIVLSFVLIIFFITQMQFYFADKQTLDNLGLSYSKHAREVFTQLSIVATVVLLLIYNSKYKDTREKILNWILGVQGIFLTLMAFRSVFEYISAWGLTYKRLYGLSFAIWVLGLFIILFTNFRQKSASGYFIKKNLYFFVYFNFTY